MGAYSSPSNGPFPSVSAVPLRTQVLTFGALGGTLATNACFADGLPGVTAWLLQTSGAGLLTVQVQLADGNIAPGVPNWEPMVPAYGIVLNVPSLNHWTIGCRQFRLSITSTGVAVVRTRLNASLT